MLPAKLCKRRSGSILYYHWCLLRIRATRDNGRLHYSLFIVMIFIHNDLVDSSVETVSSTRSFPSNFQRRVWTQVLSIQWGQADKDTRWCSSSESRMPHEKRSIRKMCTCAGSNRPPSADGIRVILILQWSCHLFVFRKWFILGNGHGWPSHRRFGIHTGPY